MRISLFHLDWHPRSLIFAASLFLVAALPVHPQPPSKAVQGEDDSPRETIDFEGMRIVFPKGEADVVELLKPALRKFREERGRATEAEAKEIAESLSSSETKETVRKMAAGFTARDSVSNEFDARWAAQAATIHALADAWRVWSGDLSELQLWGKEEVAQFQTRRDGGDDAEGFCYRFPQISFGKDGARFAMHPPFQVPLFGLDMMLKLSGKTTPLRLDLPLFYKPGESPEEIARYDRSFLEELPPFLHRGLSSEFGFGAALARWSIENMFLGEVESAIVDHRTAQETALADGIARILLFAQIQQKDGEDKTTKEFPNLFPFGMGGWDTSNPGAILSTLEKLDPLGKVDRAHVTERIFARNLIALALLDLARKDGTGSPILHKFKKTGVAVPPGGFTMDSFCAAVDAAYGEKDLFRRTVAARKALSLDQLRQSVAKQKENIAKDSETSAAKTAATAAPPNREAAKFGKLTITYPVEFKAAVGIVGPEYAKLLAQARSSMEALCKKAPASHAAEEADVNADMAALRAYGIEPNANVIREFAVLVDVMRDGTQFFRWFFSGDRMQIWIKEDMLSFLKHGGTLPDFSLNPNGENVTWNFGFSLSRKTAHAAMTQATKPEDVRAKVLERIDAAPHPAYPIILKRSSLPGNLDDPAAVAAAIRAGDEKIIGLMRAAVETPEATSRGSAGFGKLFDQEQGWFLVAHEVTEGGIVTSVIKSADRRWFCDGLANWVAMQDVDRRFGPGKGAEAFAKSYNAAELRKHAAEVDLLTWPTVEDVQNGSRHDVDDSNAYYYFATLVMQKACEGRGADFVKKWLDEIRKTPLNRANTGTVLAAYRTLTGKDLKSMIGEVVKAE